MGLENQIPASNEVPEGRLIQFTAAPDLAAELDRLQKATGLSPAQLYSKSLTLFRLVYDLSQEGITPYFEKRGERFDIVISNIIRPGS